MFRLRVCVALRASLAIVVCVIANDASAQAVRMSLADALTRAKAESPAVLVARARVEEARGRLVGARVRFQSNPYVDVTSGRRRTFDGRSTTDLEVGLLQTFETGGQRAARIAGAEAGIASELATADDAVRHGLEAVASAYLQHRLNVEREGVLRLFHENAVEVLRIAQRRYDLGDIAVLELNLAKSAMIRADTSRTAAAADVLSSNAALGRLLGLRNVVVEPTDDLARDWSADLASLLVAVDARPDLAALKASLAEAEADVRLGLADGRPDVAVGVRGKREGADLALVGVVTFTFPTFHKGQELIATGSARAARVRQELELSRTSTSSEVASLHTEYQQRRAAALAQAEALPLATENVQLSQRSYEEGELSLADLIVVRNDVLSTRLDYLDRLLDAAEVAVARDAAAGVLK